MSACPHLLTLCYEALNTKYVKAEEKWNFENFSGDSLSCNTEKPRKQRTITVKGWKSTALTWKGLKQPKGKMELTWKVDDASRSLQSVWSEVKTSVLNLLGQCPKVGTPKSGHPVQKWALYLFSDKYQEWISRTAEQNSQHWRARFGDVRELSCDLLSRFPHELRTFSDHDLKFSENCWIRTWNWL